MILAAARSHLVVIDVQERLAAAINDCAGCIANTTILLKAATRLAVPVTLTEQYPHGLGRTLADVANMAPPETLVCPKSHFSAMREPEFRERHRTLQQSGRDQIVIVGMEAHVCVLQTALDLAAMGAAVFVVGDAIGSRTSASKTAAIARMAQAGLTIVTTEMVLFEWLACAQTADFRALAPLVR